MLNFNVLYDFEVKSLLQNIGIWGPYRCSISTLKLKGSEKFIESEKWTEKFILLSYKLPIVNYFVSNHDVQNFSISSCLVKLRCSQVMKGDLLKLAD